jgi:ATP-dependent DNA ligase
MNETEEDLMLVRDILAREIETINTYQRLLSSAQTEEVKTFLRHITEEEKEHVAEAMELIMRFDRSQAALLGGADHWRQAPPQPDKATVAPQRQTMAGPLTVGSLRKTSD